MTQTDLLTLIAASLINFNSATEGDPLTIEGLAYKSSVTITRPSNTTQYSAGDMVGQADTVTPANAGSAILEFANIGPAGGSVLITTSTLMVNLAAVTASMTSFRLHLYGTSPAAKLDNALWDLPSGDRTAYLGYVDLGTPVDLGSTLWVQTDQINKQVQLTTSSIFGVMVTNGGYIPTSGEVLIPTLHAAGF